MLWEEFNAALDAVELCLGRLNPSLRGLRVQAARAPEADFCGPGVFMRHRRLESVEIAWEARVSSAKD